MTKTTLETPLTLPSGLTLKNRLAKASMSEHLADAEGNPGEALNRLYERFAQGGSGYLLSGNVMVDRRHLEGAGNVVLDENSDLKKFEAWARAGKQNGAAFLLQISHPGRQTPMFIQLRPLAPSPGKAVKVMMAFAPAVELKEAQIEGILDRFALTASLAEKAGFDGIQLHGAHGYLISQFLSATINQRRDKWGGALAGRARFLLEAVRRVREKTGKGFTLMVKLNVGDLARGNDTGDLTTLGHWLKEAGVDLVEVSSGDYEKPALYGVGASTDSKGYFAQEAMALSKTCGLAVMLTGGVRSVAGMEAALESGAASVIGLARPMAVDPDLPSKIMAGKAQSLTAPAPAFSIESLKILSETSWYGAQLELLAAGKSVNPALGVWPPLLSYLGQGMAKGVLWQVRHR